MRFNQDYSDITILIQGPILDGNGKIDRRVCNYINLTKEHLAGCAILLSTWKLESELEVALKNSLGSEVGIIFSDDPGVIYKEVRELKVISNINRMIVSTANGLEAIRTKYTVKIRTDSYLNSDSIIKKLMEIKGLKRAPRYSVFENYVLNCNLFARHHDSYLPFLYHPGDICLAGLTKDLRLLFNVPLATSELIGICHHSHSTCNMTLVPEQYIWISCLKKMGHEVPFLKNFEFDRSSAQESVSYYMNNYVPFSVKELDFVWPKFESEYSGKGKHSLYRFEDWKLYYYNEILGVPINKNFYQRFTRPSLYFFMKVIFTFRTILLKNNLVRYYAYKFFVKRKG